jgi:hypothetical protein
MISSINALTFAVLALVFLAPAMALEWYGPSYGSSYWLRRALWLGVLGCVCASTAVIAKGWGL